MTTPASPQVDPATLRDFHRPAYRDWRWLETCWFSFFIPERGMRVHLRAAFRTELGVAHTLIAVYSRSGGVLDMDFWDSQVHQPIGYNRYSDFSLPSGLKVRGRPAPDRYDVSYHSRCGRLTIDVECMALMPPVDLSFQALPDAREGFAAFHRTSSGDVSVGHIDQTFHVQGAMTLDGEQFTIDSVSNHDHSWSPRSEFRSSQGTFDEFHVGDRLTMLAQSSLADDGTASVSHAYVLVDGQLRNLRSASAAFEIDGYATRGCTYELVDSEGEEHVVNATVEHAIGQDQGSNGFTVMNYCTVQWNGAAGVGESMWHWDISTMQRLIRSGRAKSSEDVDACEALRIGLGR